MHFRIVTKLGTSPQYLGLVLSLSYFWVGFSATFFHGSLVMILNLLLGVVLMVWSWKALPRDLVGPTVTLIGLHILACLYPMFSSRGVIIATKLASAFGLATFGYGGWLIWRFQDRGSEDAHSVGK